LDVTTGVASVVNATALGGPVLSPDGSWVLGRGTPPGEGRPRWLVLAADRPTAPRPVGGADTAATVLWDAPARPRAWLDTLRIAAPAGAIPVNAPYRLAARGVSQYGRAIAVPVASWRSADSTIATVDSTGVLWPRRAGTVTVHASAGGWRADSVVIEVGEANAEMIIEEDWTGGIGPAWVPFGEPRPAVVREAGASALWNHGDSSFESGVYSRRAMTLGRGLGIEARVSAPLTAFQWQTQAIRLERRTDGPRLAAWDHRTGGPPGYAEASLVCAASFPGGEGSIARQRIGLAAGDRSRLIDAPPDMPAGRWHRVRIQLFSDGRCGFAVDGVPVWVSPDPLPLDAPFHVALFGRSHGTRVLVGRVEAWTGVRGDIDWRTARVGSVQ
jgi:hypothetical protein